MTFLLFFVCVIFIRAKICLWIGKIFFNKARNFKLIEKDDWLYGRRAPLWPIFTYFSLIHFEIFFITFIFLILHSSSPLPLPHTFFQLYEESIISSPVNFENFCYFFLGFPHGWFFRWTLAISFQTVSSLFLFMRPSWFCFPFFSRLGMLSVLKKKNLFFWGFSLELIGLALSCVIRIIRAQKNKF